MTVRVVKFKEAYEGKKRTDMVLIAPSGEGHTKTQTWHRVDKLRPPKDADENQKNSATHFAMSARWSVIGPAYEAWKAGSEIPDDGTPLAAWSGVSAEVAELLKSMAIRTVEDVRDMSESTFTKLPVPNARQLPGLARDFLDGADSAEKDKQIAEMAERMAAMEEMLEAQTKPKKKETEKAA